MWETTSVISIVIAAVATIISVISTILTIRSSLAAKKETKISDSLRVTIKSVSGEEREIVMSPNKVDITEIQRVIEELNKGSDKPENNVN